MTMAGTYTSGGGLDDAESIATIHRALDLGVTHIDTAEVYGPYHSEELVGRAIAGRRDSVVVATKFVLVSHADGGVGIPDSSPANTATAVEGSLRRLGTDHIDLYYQHRVDPHTP